MPEKQKVLNSAFRSITGDDTGDEHLDDTEENDEAAVEDTEDDEGELLEEVEEPEDKPKGDPDL